MQALYRPHENPMNMKTISLGFKTFSFMMGVLALWRSALMRLEDTQRLQYPLIKGYTLKHNRILSMI